MKRIFCIVALIAVLSGCSKKPQTAPEQYRVTLDTSKGPVVIEVHRDWAPLGADRFYALVNQEYFDNARFFRVIPGFMAQFGLAADPKTTAKWEGTELADDPAKQSNVRGMVSFATRGPQSRTTQLFINTGNNTRLDASGFAPFGRVESGMSAVDEFYNVYGETPDQGSIKLQGNTYLQQSFPLLDFIKTARITP